MQHLKEAIVKKGPTVETPTESQWIEFEANFLCLPQDFKDYLSYFGSGWLADFFLIWNPFSESNEMNWHLQKELTLKAFNQIREEHPQFFKEWRLFPETDGLLPFGITINGDTMFWKTGLAPNSWTVAVGRDEPLGFYDGPLNSFLWSSLVRPPFGENLPDLRGAPRTFSIKTRWEI